MQGVQGVLAAARRHPKRLTLGGLVGMVLTFWGGTVVDEASQVHSLLGLLFWASLAATCYGLLSGAARQRDALSREAQRWAGEHGWSYAARDDSVLTGWSGDPFVGGPGRPLGDMAVDVLRRHRPVLVAIPGAADRDGGQPVELETVSFVYRYVTGQALAGLVKNYADVAVTAVRLPAVLPRLAVGPEDALAAARKRLGAADHLIESADFNGTYFVEADHPRTAHDVLHARLAQRLLQPDLIGRPWIVERGWIRTWDLDGPQTAVVDRHLRLLEAVVSRVPRHVWQDAQTGARRA